MSNNLFKQELEHKVKDFLTEDRVAMVKEATEKYFPVNNTVNGKEFFEKYILDAAKDYPTTSMKFYQAVTELKSRLGRLFDDSIALQKLEIEKELIEIEIEEMHKTLKYEELTRKEQLNIELKRQDLLTKSVKIGFSKESLMALTQEVDDFKALCDQYVESGEIKPYEIARCEEMEKKKRLLYLHSELHGKQMTPSELAFFLQEDGTVRPPEGVEEDLIRLGEVQGALAVERKRNTIDRAKQARESGEKLPDLSEIKKQMQLQHQQQEADGIHVVKK